ncbi:MAG: hypothetical protein M0R80_10760 [Proteobacteria bacterium]|nr:hypothetical protein [Pseudomonadota bacterium]
MAKTCKMCGTPNGDEIQFCAACGSALDGDQGQLKRGAQKPGSMPAKTMMFGVAPQAAAPQVAAPQAPAPPAGAPMVKMPAKTMLGVPAVGSTQAMAQPQAQAPMAQPAPMARPVQPAAAAQATSPSEAWRDKRTVLGMPAVVTEAAEPPAPAPAPASASVPTSAPTMAAPRAAHPETVPIEPQGKPAPAPRKPTMRVEPIREDPRGRGEDWDDDEPPARKRGGKGLVIIAIAAGAVLLIGAALLVYLLVFRGGGGLQPQVFPAADGQTLTIVLAFPSAPVGAAVQVQGQTVQIMGGQARFDLPRTQLKLGENPVQVTYIEPGAAPKAESFTISLRYAITDDMTGLVTATPSFNVGFQVAEGVQLAISGRPVQTANGLYTLNVPLSQVATVVESGESLIHKISFQISDPAGLTEQGQHVVTIPTTKLQVDRPAPNAVVAMESVPCAGVTEEGAVVTVNGAPAGVTAAGFHASAALPAIGEHTVTITARAPGKAPRTQAIKITRIQSLDAAVAEWGADLDASIDYPTLARDPNVHVGKKVKFRGRVVNISTERGVTALLLYVGTGCPAGAKCAIYVAFRGETDAGLQSMVDVYGKVRGTWDVQLQGGKQETMPALDAEFVIRSDDASTGKKRR